MFICQLYLNDTGKIKQEPKKEKYKEIETMRSRETNVQIIGASDYFWFQTYTYYTHTFLISFNARILLPVIHNETAASSLTPPFLISHRNPSASPIYLQNSLSSEPDHLSATTATIIYHYILLPGCPRQPSVSLLAPSPLPAYSLLSVPQPVIF